jgi:hypothetical protein
MNNAAIQFPSLIKSDELLGIQNLPANGQLTIYDLQGKVIFQQTFYDEVLTIPLGTLSPGFFIAALHINGAILTKKIMVY